MPKVKWAHDDSLRKWQNSIDSTPVMTLDAVEVWLKSHLKERRMSTSLYNGVIDDLLTQVKAMKGKP